MVPIVLMLIVVILGVLNLDYLDECHYAGCQYAECCGAVALATKHKPLKIGASPTPDTANFLQR